MRKPGISGPDPSSGGIPTNELHLLKYWFKLRSFVQQRALTQLVSGGSPPMRFVTMFTAAAFTALFSVSAMAQTATAPSTTTTTPSATTTAPAATTMPKAATTMKPKAMKPAQTAVSKACSAQADAKGLHGKARAKFRSDCKKAGGKA